MINLRSLLQEARDFMMEVRHGTYIHKPPVDLIDRIDAALRDTAEPRAAHVNAGYKCEHEWKVEGLGGRARCDICGVFRDAQNRGEKHE